MSTSMTSINMRRTALAGLACCTALLNACGTSSSNYGISADAIKPHIGGNMAVLEEISGSERAHLQLIATNMISTLVQVPSMQSGAITLQINEPRTAYGNALVRALEDAGFGLQRVSADQGQNYVSYSKRLSETESGLVTDYQLTVGKIAMRREYSKRGNLIYPSSLMTISGASSISDIELADSIFVEQGGRDSAFISGVQLEGQPDPDLSVKTIDVRNFDELPLDKRTPQGEVFTQARERYFQIQANRQIPPLQLFEKYRRTVLIFDDNNTQMMGAANKQAVRLLVRGFSDDDIMLIKACLDADGSNDAAMTRAIRVEQELLGFGIPSQSTFIAPCARASYRHSSDDSPTPVELVHYRPRKS